MSKDKQKTENELKNHEEEKLDGMPLDDLLDYVREFHKKANKGEEPYKTLREEIGNYPRHEPVIF